MVLGHLYSLASSPTAATEARIKSEEPSSVSQASGSYNRTSSTPPEEQPALRPLSMRRLMIQKAPLPKRRPYRDNHEPSALVHSSELNTQSGKHISGEGALLSNCAIRKDGQSTILDPEVNYVPRVLNGVTSIKSSDLLNAVPAGSMPKNSPNSATYSSGVKNNDTRKKSPTLCPKSDIKSPLAYDTQIDFQSGDPERKIVSGGSENGLDSELDRKLVYNQPQKVHQSTNNQTNKQLSPDLILGKILPSSSEKPLKVPSSNSVQKTQRMVNNRVSKPVLIVNPEAQPSYTIDRSWLMTSAVNIPQYKGPGLQSKRHVQAQQLNPRGWDPSPFVDGARDEPLQMLPHSYYYKYREEIPIVHAPKPIVVTKTVAPSELIPNLIITQPLVQEQYRCGTVPASLVTQLKSK